MDNDTSRWIAEGFQDVQNDRGERKEKENGSPR